MGYVFQCVALTHTFSSIQVFLLGISYMDSSGFANLDGEKGKNPTNGEKNVQFSWDITSRSP